jgi:hypothetical protein
MNDKFLVPKHGNLDIKKIIGSRKELAWVACDTLRPLYDPRSPVKVETLPGFKSGRAVARRMIELMAERQSTPAIKTPGS